MNANKIRAKIIERGMTQGEVAKIIGISANSLSRKLLGKRDFLLSEVIALCSVLELDNPQEIFLEEKSQKRNDAVKTVPPSQEAERPGA